ncbi:MAG: TMEM165/GDT1 family protein [Pseudonocardiales bacterium]|nr:TMEM165/GDT1 family protein [Actinomycetota bacterium]
MPHSLSAAVIAFAVVLLVELPDKTLVATLVLSTRYRPRPVLLGVAAAFAVQSVIAVTAGGLLHLLPRWAVETAVAVLFGIGAVLLLREGFAEVEQVDLEQHAARAAAPFWQVALTSFGVIFAAEWGDASQLASAALAARLGNPVAVGLGAWVALTVVAAIAVVAGRLILRRVPVRMVHRVAGVLFAAFAVVAAVGAVRS